MIIKANTCVDFDRCCFIKIDVTEMAVSLVVRVTLKRRCAGNAGGFFPAITASNCCISSALPMAIRTAFSSPG